MKAFKIAAAALLITGLVSSNAFAAGATGTAEAEVVTPLTFDAGQGNGVLSFGGIVSQPAAGSVDVDFANGVSSATHQLVVPTTASTATFVINGDGNRSIVTSVDASVTLSNGTPADDMVATLTNSAPTALAGGTATMSVGGSLAVGAGQTADSYSGTFAVTANYN